MHETDHYASFLWYQLVCECDIEMHMIVADGYAFCAHADSSFHIMSAQPTSTITSTDAAAVAPSSPSSHRLVIRDALSSDAERILELIHELAVYERAPDAVQNTVSQLIEDGWGRNLDSSHSWPNTTKQRIQLPRSQSVQPSDLHYVTMRTLLGRATVCSSRICTCKNRIVHAVSVWRS